MPKGNHINAQISNLINRASEITIENNASEQQNAYLESMFAFGLIM